MLESGSRLGKYEICKLLSAGRVTTRYLVNKITIGDQ